MKLWIAVEILTAFLLATLACILLINGMWLVGCLLMLFAIIYTKLANISYKIYRLNQKLSLFTATKPYTDKK